MPVPKTDVSQTFLVYMALVGDAEKTALALDLDVEEVKKLAQREGWAEKVRRISVVSKSGSEGDWERAQNRALNFVQAHQLRRLMDATLAQAAEDDKLVDLITRRDKNGDVKVTASFFKDMAAAMTSIHQMSYDALGDSAKERVAAADRKGADDPVAAAGLHSAMIAALNAKGLPEGTAAATLADTANQTVESLKPEST